MFKNIGKLFLLILVVKFGVLASISENESPLSISGLVGMRQFTNSKFDHFDINPSSLVLGAKVNYQVNFLNLEFSFLPTMRFGNWSDNKEDSERLLFLPFTLSARIQPTMLGWKITPFAGVGMGPTFVDSRVRTVNRPDLSGMTEATSTYKVDYYPGGVTFHGVAMFGFETKIKEKYVLGIDLRGYVAGIANPKFTDEEIINDTREIDDGVTQTDQLHKLYDWSYRNLTPMIYFGKVF